MDKVDRNRDIVRLLINEYAGYKVSHGEVQAKAICNPEHDHYEVMHVGWDGSRLVHGSVIHIDLRGGKVFEVTGHANAGYRPRRLAGKSSQHSVVPSGDHAGFML